MTDDCSDPISSCASTGGRSGARKRDVCSSQKDKGNQNSAAEKGPKKEDVQIGIECT